MSAITVRDVRYCAGRTPILHGVDMDVTPGSFTAVIGPNGSGKSTLVRCLAGLVRFSGHIEVDGHDVARTARKEMARSVAVVAQQPEAVEAHSVREVIALGRTPYLGALSGATAHDHHVVRDAATRTGVEHLLERTFSTCSGGERQRTHIARALAQECEVLLLDEPTNHLDVQQQFSILELVDAADITTLAVLHDLNLAAQFADHIVVLDSGRIAAAGPPREVLTPDIIEDVFGMRPQVLCDDHRVNVHFHRQASTRRG